MSTMSNLASVDVAPKPAAGVAAAPAGARVRRLAGRMGSALVPLAGIAALLALWELVSRYGGTDLPSPARTWEVSKPLIVEPFAKRGELDQGILRFTWYSLVLVAKGYTLALLIGTPLILLAVGGVLLVLSRVIRRRGDAGQLVVVALVAFMVLPAYAFFNGHPFRMRYMVAPAVGAAVFAGIALGMLKGRWRDAAAAATSKSGVCTLPSTITLPRAPAWTRGACSANAASASTTGGIFYCLVRCQSRNLDRRSKTGRNSP